MEEQVTRGAVELRESRQEIMEHKHEPSQWKETWSTQSAELSELRGEVGALRRGNANLKGEIEAQKAQVNKSVYNRLAITHHLCTSWLSVCHTNIFICGLLRCLIICSIYYQIYILVCKS